MTLWEVSLLAFVQGLTEFLPVSSSGHLLVARRLFGISNVEGTTVDAFLHLGTLGALLVYYWPVWRGLAASLWGREASRRDQRALLVNIGVATLPAAAAGYLFQSQIETVLRGPRVLIASFLTTAFILWWFDRPHTASSAVQPASTGDATPRLSWRDAVIIGLAQVAALVPAISRSGVTIAAGRARHLSRRQATTFSFLLSAPIIAGASLSSLGALLQSGSLPGQLLVVGLLISFASGLLAIYLLMRLVERVSFLPFVIYLVALSALLWIAEIFPT